MFQINLSYKISKFLGLYLTNLTAVVCLGWFGWRVQSSSSSSLTQFGLTSFSLARFGAKHSAQPKLYSTAKLWAQPKALGLIRHNKAVWKSEYNTVVIFLCFEKINFDRHSIALSVQYSKAFWACLIKLPFPLLL